MKALTLAFGPPEHGWMVVTLSRLSARPEGDARQVDASDVPCDSLAMLARAPDRRSGRRDLLDRSRV